MRGGDLHRVGLRVDAGPPVDDAVASRVDRGERDVGRHRLPTLVEALPGAVAGHAVLGHQTGDAGPAQPNQDVDAGGEEQVVGTGREHRAAHRHDPGDQVGPTDRQPTRQHATQAVPDDPDPAAALDRDRLDARLELLRSGAGAADVGADVGAVGAEAAAAQAPAHRAQGGVARHEAGDEDHRLLGAWDAAGGVGRDPAPAPLVHRGQGVAAGLEDQAALPQHLDRSRTAEAVRQEEVTQGRVVLPGAGRR